MEKLYTENRSSDYDFKIEPAYEIAGRVDCEDLAHFGRLFKKAHGGAATEYREHYKRRE